MPYTPKRTRIVPLTQTLSRGADWERYGRGAEVMPPVRSEEAHGTGPPTGATRRARVQAPATVGARGAPGPGAAATSSGPAATRAPTGAGAGMGAGGPMLRGWGQLRRQGVCAAGARSQRPDPGNGQHQPGAGHPRGLRAAGLLPLKADALAGAEAQRHPDAPAIPAPPAARHGPWPRAPGPAPGVATRPGASPTAGQSPARPPAGWSQGAALSAPSSSHSRRRWRRVCHGPRANRAATTAVSQGCGARSVPYTPNTRPRRWAGRRWEQDSAPVWSMCRQTWGKRRRHLRPCHGQGSLILPDISALSQCSPLFTSPSQLRERAG